MQLKEFVNSHVETVQSDDTLQRAAEKMRELDVGSMPVFEGGQLVGSGCGDGARSYDAGGFVLL